MRSVSLLFFLLVLLPGAPALSGCDSQQGGQCNSADTFAIEDITPEGTTLGAAAEGGSCVTVDYVGRFAATDEVFDEGTGLSFFVTTNGGVVPGFALGVNNQQVGQTRRVLVPPNFGYGFNGLKDLEGVVIIPSCSTLEFDITLVRINQDIRLCG